MKYFSRSQNRRKNLRPPDLYEYFVDNYWFKSVELENQKINEPLRGSHKADVVIVGGGFTGLSSAYHIRQKFPVPRIVFQEITNGLDAQLGKALCSPRSHALDKLHRRF